MRGRGGFLCRCFCPVIFVSFFLFFCLPFEAQAMAVLDLGAALSGTGKNGTKHG